jgi:UDP-N-acetylmuramate dehydrogenase
LSKFEYNFSLKDYNTFNIDVTSKEFFACSCENDLIDFLIKINSPKDIFVLGGGSNILFTKNFDGLIINMQNSKIEILNSNNDFVYVKADAGVIWDNFVEFCVENNFYGAENLSLIPGTVGASPVQNIGAYGTEAKDIIFEVNAVKLINGQKQIFSNSECEFGYRDSIFKNSLLGRNLVTSVVFKLNKKPIFNLEYGNIKEEFEKSKQEINLRNVRNTIINIRQSKLPDPKVSPNAGSFFKNPVIDETLFGIISQKFPYLISYPAGEGKVKTAAGQLIDKAGFKGFKLNNVATHSNQALVIIKTGNASGAEIKYFSEHIKKAVLEKFGIALEPEVNIL